MEKTNVFIVVLTVLCYNFYGCTAQVPFGAHLLQLNKKILYMAALGNNTVEVVDISTGKII